jgi:hypothetical protein
MERQFFGHDFPGGNWRGFDFDWAFVVVHGFYYLFGAHDGGADGGFGNGAQALGAVILVTAQLDPAQTIGARLESERLEGGVRAE